jgi:hypothetical protein
MSQPNRAAVKSGNAPWILASVLAVLVVVLALALVRVLAVRHDSDRSGVGWAAPTTADQQAVTAGATEAANILSFTRKNFGRDFDRALAGATGKLRSDLAAKRTLTLSQMTRGKFDLKADVVRSAFESEDGGAVLLLVTVNGSRVGDTGQASVPSTQRLELTMVRQGGKWLASNLLSVGIQ